jgi:hypothetical protein
LAEVVLREGGLSPFQGGLGSFLAGARRERQNDCGQRG